MEHSALNTAEQARFVEHASGVSGGGGGRRRSGSGAPIPLVLQAGSSHLRASDLSQGGRSVGTWMDGRIDNEVDFRCGVVIFGIGDSWCLLLRHDPDLAVSLEQSLASHESEIAMNGKIRTVGLPADSLHGHPGGIVFGSIAHQGRIDGRSSRINCTPGGVIGLC